MDVDKRDYEYYKEHAKDVQLEDITSSEHNAYLLEMIRDGDSDWNGKVFLLEEEVDGDPDEFVVREGDDLGWLGYFLGSSEHVLELNMRYFPHRRTDAMNEFMDGFKHNKSLEALYISTDLGRDGFKSLGELLRSNENLERLCLHEFMIGEFSARGIASMLGQEQCKSLRYLFFVQNSLCLAGLTYIVTALRKQPQLEELKICGCNNFDGDGCFALGSTFECWEGASLRCLYLCHNNIGDNGLEALVKGMAKCNYLEALVLSGNPGITREGCYSLSNFLRSKSCCLEMLALDQTNVEGYGVTALAAGLSSNLSLKQLCLAGNSICDEGVNALVHCLPNCRNLEELDLSDNVDGGFSAVGLKYLTKAFQPGSNLKNLLLRDNDIDDKGLMALTEGMANNCSITKLDLSRNGRITPEGLKNLLRSGRSCLKELELWGIRIGDDGAKVLADELVGNTTLERLYFCPGYSNIRAKGWKAFSRLLCDGSSVNDTYASNHTISNICSQHSLGAPSLTRFHVFLNQHFDSKDAATLKILIHHRDIDMMPFFRWRLMFLPLVVDWFQRAMPCYEAIFQAIPRADILQAIDW